ncbi:MAG: CHAP domain-containing protein, partial [Bacteroidales bacterium]|nr:CHAP domain-containing protein [Bacteroidales bacterium]
MSENTDLPNETQLQSAEYNTQTSLLSSPQQMESYSSPAAEANGTEIQDGQETDQKEKEILSDVPSVDEPEQSIDQLPGSAESEGVDENAEAEPVDGIDDDLLTQGDGVEESEPSTKDESKEADGLENSASLPDGESEEPVNDLPSSSDAENSPVNDSTDEQKDDQVEKVVDELPETDQETANEEEPQVSEPTEDASDEVQDNQHNNKEETGAEDETNAENQDNELNHQPDFILNWNCESKREAQVGDHLIWTFEYTGADRVIFSLSDQTGTILLDGELVGSSTIEWIAAKAGQYILTVTAYRENDKKTITSTVLVEKNPLYAAVTSNQSYAFANENTLVFYTDVGELSEGSSVGYAIDVNGECVFTQSGYSKEITYSPVGFGVHTLKMTVTDSDGEIADAEYSIPVAVREYESQTQWERTFSGVELSGDYATDIVRIATTQIGYTESHRNFIIDAEGKVKGYTRYGDWYGSCYSDWCAMFVSFCAHYAQIPEQYLPYEAGCNSWKQKLGELYLDDEDAYSPQAGDLVFFHMNLDGEAASSRTENSNAPNHVGIISKVTGSRISTIEGNSGNMVQCREYGIGDSAIVGYVSMEQVYARAHRGNEDSDVKENAEIEEQPEEPDAPMQNQAAFVEIIKPAVNLRERASASSEKVGQAKQGDTYDWLSTVENESGELWHQIQADGHSAFVRGDLAVVHGEVMDSPENESEGALEDETGTSEVETPEDGSTASAGETGYVEIIKNAVNLREEADKGSKKIGQASQGNVYDWISSVENEKGELWYQIAFEDASVYVRSDLATLHLIPQLVEEEHPNDKLENVVISDEPTAEEGTTHDSETTEITDESPLEDRDTESDVASDSENQGTMEDEIVEATPGEAQSDTEQEEEEQESESNLDTPMLDEAPYIEIVADQTALHEDASRESQTTSEVFSGETYELLAEVTNEAGELWYQIILGDGSTAFVYSEAVVVHHTVAIEPVDGTTDINEFEQLPYEDVLPDGFEAAENGLYRLVIDADADESYLMVYGRFGDGEALFYLCDDEGIPLGEDMFWVPAEDLASDSLVVDVQTDQSEYLKVDGKNTVKLTVRIKASNVKALGKGKKLTVTLSSESGVQKLKFKNAVVDGKTVTFSFQETESSIELTAGGDVNDSMVTLTCEYSIPLDAEVGEVSLNVSASENGKNLSGSDTVTFANSEPSGMLITAVDAPEYEVNYGEAVTIPVTLTNFDPVDYGLTGFVVTDGEGTEQSIPLENTTVAGNGNDTVNCLFTVPYSGNGVTNYSITANYSDADSNSLQTNAMSFSLTLPVASSVVLAEDTVLVSYDANDNASFSQIRVKVTDNASSTDGKRNTNNKGRLEIRNEDGTWSTAAEITNQTSISGGNFYFDLNGLSAEQILNNQYRVLITAVNGRNVTAGQEPQSEWFYLTDLLPKAGFRDWALNPESGYVDAAGNLLISSADELAEAYKVYERLGLNASVGTAAGAAGSITKLTVSIASDETMSSGGTITIRLSDVTEELSDADRIAFDAVTTANTQSGTVTVENGMITVMLNSDVAAGTNVDVTVDVPLSYAAALDTHVIDAFAQYRQDGAILKQTQNPGQGLINVMAPTGWHLVAVSGPDAAVTPGENVSYELTVRNFSATEAILTGLTAAIDGSSLQIVGLRVNETDISLDNVQVTVPAAVSGEDGAIVPGETVILLRVQAPEGTVENTEVTFTAADTSKEETMQSTITVIEPAITIKP